MDPGLQNELYEERRRHWRRSGFWRGIGLSLLLLTLVVAGLAWAGRSARAPHLAEVVIEGLITEDNAREALLADLARDPAVRGVILRVSSGGGTLMGSEQLHVGLRALAQAKPMVAVMGEVAASGGLIAALAADHVIARENTLTGSISVMMEYPDFSGLLSNLGVSVEVVRSGALKGDPSPFRGGSPQARQALEDLARAADGWLRDLVAARRGLAPDAVAALADGAAFRGRQALDAGLIDQIGGLPEAKAWLQARDPSLADLPLRLYGGEDAWSIGPLAARWAADLAGIAEGGRMAAATAPRLWALGP